MNRLSRTHFVGGLLITLMIAATLALLWAYWSHDASEESRPPVGPAQPTLDSDSNDTDPSSSHGLDERHEFPAQASSAPAVRLQQRYIAAQRAIDAQAIVDEAWALGLDVALDWQMELNGCGGTHSQQRLAPIVSTFVTTRVRFCEGFDAQHTEIDALVSNVDSEMVGRMLYEQKAHTKATVRVLDAMIAADGDMTEFMSAYLDLLAGADSWQELDGIFLGLSMAEENAYLWFSELNELAFTEPFPATLPVSWHPALLMEAAADLYGCRNFGGCGPFELRSLQYCVAAGCSQPTDLYSLWQTRLLPADAFQMSLRLADVFQQRRSTRTGHGG